MKFVAKTFLILILVNVGAWASETDVVLRFKTCVTSQANHLGDVLTIQNDKQHWANLPLDSQPVPGEIITSDKMFAWMIEKTAHTHFKWQGKTHITVTQATHSSASALREKARMALVQQLESHYLRVDVVPVSNLKDSPYKLDDFKASSHLTYPIAKRVCVWLVHRTNKTTRIAVWFKVRAFNKVLVANRVIRPNTTISSDALSLKVRNIAGLHTHPALKLPAHVWLKSSIEPNAILLQSQLKEPPLIVHGQRIKVATHNHGITIVMEACALKDGYLGDTIPVKNPLNKKIFLVKIRGSQQTEIAS